jgi:hypothetical protein
MSTQSSLTKDNIRETLQSKNISIKQPEIGLNGWCSYEFYLKDRKLEKEETDSLIRQELGLGGWRDLIQLTDQAGITIDVG